ncbi:peptide-binding protein, partial [Pseudomonas sp. HMWF010]
QALGRTRDGRWILVGQDGVGVGYVSSAYVYRA